MTYIHREIEPLVIKLTKQFPAVAITGPRQSGKSTLLKNLFQKTHRFVSFDDPLTRQRVLTDTNLFLADIKEPVVFDEVQYVPEILSYLKILIDRDRGKKGRFILTGSQQFNLIKNLGDSLAGRIGLLTLLPFSKQEKKAVFLRSRKQTTSSLDYFVDACLRGSYPEISVEQRVDFENWYGSYLQTYIERDVRSIYEIGSLREFERFLQLLAGRCSQLLNLSGLASDLGVAVNTIKKWVSILEASNLIYLLAPYYKNLGKRITKAPKLYFLDCGLVSYLVGIRDKKTLVQGSMFGALFENYIVQETVKAFFSRGKRPNIFYLRGRGELEVDLVIDKETAIFPVEIKASQSPSLAMAQSMEKVSQIFSGLNMMPGKIISLSAAAQRLTDKVSTQTINDYLNWIKE